MPIDAATPELRDKIIADARSLPQLIDSAQKYDPALAQKLVGQATLQSATPLGALAGAAVGWVASRYALNWDANTCAFVGGLLCAAGGYVTHWVQARMTSITP